MKREDLGTRREQHPAWLVEGLVRHAVTSRERPDEPMFGTGVTYSQLKARVKDMLLRSGLNLTRTELSSGTHWLTERIANQIGEKDTSETLDGYVSDLVNHYILDKAMQRATGVHQRTPIYTREWYEKYFTTSPEQSEEKGDEPMERGAAADKPMVYVAIDGDDIGHLVEESLLTDDPEVAEKISLAIHAAHDEIRKLIQKTGGKIIFDGGDNMLLYVPYEPATLEALREIYIDETEHTATVGVGRRPIEAHFSLVVGKNTGKDRVVVYDENVKDKYEQIKAEQEALAPMYQKLKYRASAEITEIGAAPKIAETMKALGLPVDDEAVYDMFLRLVERFGLSDIDELHRFFDQPDLSQQVREVYAKRMNWGVRIAQREMSDFEWNKLLEDCDRFVCAVYAMAPKFGLVCDLAVSRGDSTLKPVLDEFRAAVQRAWSSVAELIAKKIAHGLRPTWCDWVEDVPGLAGEIASMSGVIDCEFNKVVVALDNADATRLAEKPDFPVDTRPLIDCVTKLIEKIALFATAMDMICVVSASDPKVVVRQGQEAPRFPGQTNLPRSKRQQSPRRPHDWLTTEERNRDSVDYSATDWQYVSTNIPRDSQMMVGGDQGQPIYVP